MKNFRILSILAISFVLLSSAVSKTNLITKSSSLEIKGYVFDKNVKLDGARVKLFQNNRVVQMTKTKNSKFQFILFSGMKYMVEISNPGSVTERIQISTEEKTQFGGKYLYEFRVDLMSLTDFKGVDISDLDFPTALIKYDMDEGEYAHDIAYSKQVKVDLKKLKQAAQK